jgi:DNA polymerase-3 subunit alpha
LSFVHLHTHTQYSLLDGANKIKDLIPHVAAAGMPALAMTDHGNMFGAVDFYQACEKGGVQPIIGCEVYVAPRSRFDKAQARSEDPETGGNYHLVLLARNEKGYRNLCRLVTQAYTEGFYYKPRIDRELLEEFNDGLFCLSGCLGSEVNQAIQHGDIAKAHRVASEFARIFDKDRYYIEVQDNHMKEQEVSNRELFSLAKKLGLPLIATNDCHYLQPGDAEAHEALLCIQTGKTLSDPTRFKFPTDQLFVKTPEEMANAFRDYPEAISNTLDLAKRCDFKMSFGQYEFPDYALEQGDTLEAALERDTRAGLAKRLEAARKHDKTWDEGRVPEYEERLNIELKVINSMGFAGYFLIVSDFILWAKRHDIPVGPGRGSAAGSLVAYSMEITDIDPIPLGLLFERFLNPERISMPDIDVDFCYERRDEVIQYVREKYGEDRVAQIITFGTLKGKAALKDVGRVLEFTYAETDKMAKLYPAARQGKDFPLQAALEMEPRLKEIATAGDRERQLFGYATKLEGLMRHSSKHAAGLVVGSRPLVESLPLCVDKGNLITQFPGGDVEAIGLIKFDFLGLKNLTLIADIVRRVKETRGVEVDLATLPRDDPKSYKIFCKGETVGIFQMESSGMRELVQRLKPTTFEEITAVNALYRPGPLDSGMTDNFVDRKHGREDVAYPHPKLEGILKETYGIMVYQEQVMQSAQILAGYSLGDADNLRRAMGKKKIDVMAKERDRFMAGCQKNKIPQEQAGSIFDQMEKFAGYGFNKSHAAAYALISFQTAYLKAHYPDEFIAGLMTLEMGDSDKTHKNIAEARERKIEVLPPDINESREDFTVVAPRKIRFGLGAVKGLGGKAIEAILAERDERGRFGGLDDLITRVRAAGVNRKALDSLVKCGAFDFCGIERSTMAAALEDILRWSQVAASNVNQRNLFADGPAGGPERFRFERGAEWGEAEKLRFEKDTLGFFITGHPLDRYKRQLTKLVTARTLDLRQMPNQQKVTLAGVVQGLRPKNTRKGDRYASFYFEDLHGHVEVIAWPDTYRKHEELFFAGEPLCLNGRLDVTEERCQVIAETIVRLDEARARAVREVQIRISEENITEAEMRYLGRTLELHRGEIPAYLHIIRKRFETRIALESHPLSTTQDLLVSLSERFAKAEVKFIS